MTINDAWGYKPREKNQKSVNYIIRIFSDCISMGGNLLLDVGPMEDGTFTPEQTKNIEGLGAMDKKTSGSHLRDTTGNSMWAFLRTDDALERPQNFVLFCS